MVCLFSHTLKVGNSVFRLKICGGSAAVSLKYLVGEKDLGEAGTGKQRVDRYDI